MKEWTEEQVAADPLAASQTIADLRFSLKQALGQRDLLEVKASHAKVPRWIPLTERLPPDNVAVLVNDQQGGVEMAFRQHGQWCMSWTNYLHSGSGYTHWMPLPEPPEVK